MSQKHAAKPTATWHADVFNDSSDEFDDDPTGATYENIERLDRQTRLSAQTTIRTANGKNFMLTNTDEGHQTENPGPSGNANPPQENTEEEERSEHAHSSPITNSKPRKTKPLSCY
ncbi:hypothetical protein PUN28_020743 [Cardiocondyla obscurior]|uniref:Uncharacterized protein n=1 Tax=Cardiocondyla obscurior TaxID=286306 RepID=A0AAW2E550_9HYME